MHPTLLTQLLGKVGEAWLTHAKAINLPSLLEQAVLSWFMLAASFWRKGEQHIVIQRVNFNLSQSGRLVFCLPACAELACV